MNSFLTQIRIAIVATILFAVVCSGIYPVVIWGFSQLLFPYQANGSIVKSSDNKTRIGSSLLAQGFSGAKYFHPRPSATTEPDPKDATKTIPVPYAADNSSGSNLGPTQKDLIERVKGDAATLAKENPGTPIPVDLVTTSASGLDPDITPAGAMFQVPRVANARGLPVDQVRALVEAHVQGRTLGVLGEPVVNVLELNLALDALK